MGERDAFGNPVDHDPHADAHAAFAAPEVLAVEAVHPDRARATPAPPGPRRPRRRSGLAGALIGLAVLALVVGGPVLLVVMSVADDVEQVLDRPLPKLPSLPSLPSLPAVPGATPPSVATPSTRARTLLPGRTAMRRMLRDLRRVAGTRRPRLLRVAPDRLDLQVVNRNGAMRNLQVVPGGRARDVGPGGRFPGRGFAWSAIDPAAPGRLRRAVRRPDYVVLIDAAGLRWSVHRDGRSWLADRHGRGVRRTG